MVGPVEVAVAVGALVAVLLYLKESLHGVTTKLKEADVKAVMQFAVISLVILPVLPDRFFGPYAVLNLRHIWLMVVLVVGISLVGYVLYKFLTPSAGALMGGLLGGFVSSTATT
ncbi:MgtC/SapB family protein, partial [bacterium]|nr:MgtC/SapB family protein [bacterium]